MKMIKKITCPQAILGEYSFLFSNIQELLYKKYSDSFQLCNNESMVVDLFESPKSAFIFDYKQSI